MRYLVLSSLLAFAAVSPAAAQPASRNNVASIQYTFTNGGIGGAAAQCMRPPCFSYHVTVNANGTGRIEDARSGISHRFRVSPRTWRTLVGRLDAYRPLGRQIVDSGSPNCGRQDEVRAIYSDPFRMIRWTGRTGQDVLAVNLSCGSGDRHAAAARMERVRSILFDLLPIARPAAAIEQAGHGG